MARGYRLLAEDEEDAAQHVSTQHPVNEPQARHKVIRNPRLADLAFATPLPTGGYLLARQKDPRASTITTTPYAGPLGGSIQPGGWQDDTEARAMPWEAAVARPRYDGVQESRDAQLRLGYRANEGEVTAVDVNRRLDATSLHRADLGVGSRRWRARRTGRLGTFLQQQDETAQPLPSLAQQVAAAGVTHGHRVDFEFWKATRKYDDDLEQIREKFRKKREGYITAATPVSAVGQITAAQQAQLDQQIREAQHLAKQEEAQRQAEARQRQIQAEQKAVAEARARELAAQEEARRIAEAQAAQKAEELAARKREEGRELQRRAVEAKEGQPVDGAPGVRLFIHPTAKQFEEHCKQVFDEVAASVKAMGEGLNRAQKKALQKEGQQVNMKVTQIAGTWKQINAKSQELLQLLGQAEGSKQKFLYKKLAETVMSQLESQVKMQSNAAVPLVQVLAQVARVHPEVITLVMAKLHQVCPISVPRHYIATSNTVAHSEAFLKLLAYDTVEPNETEAQPSNEPVWEGNEPYVQRIAAYMYFYGVLVAAQGHLLGLDHAWMYLARVLNTVPPTRVSATAVENFLKVPGYFLSRKWGRHFDKMLGRIRSKYIEGLENSKEDGAQPVVTRLQEYIGRKRYLEEPKELDLPMDVCIESQIID